MKLGLSEAGSLSTPDTCTHVCVPMHPCTHTYVHARRICIHVYTHTVSSGPDSQGKRGSRLL